MVRKAPGRIIYEKFGGNCYFNFIKKTYTGYRGSFPSKITKKKPSKEITVQSLS